MFFLRRGAKTRKSGCFSPVSLKSDAIFAFFGEAMLSMLHQEQKTKKAESLTKKEPFRQEFAPKKQTTDKNAAKLLQKPRFLLFFRQFFAENVCFFQKRRIKVSENAIFGNCFAKSACFAVFFSKKRRFCFLACFFVLCCVLFLFRNLRNFCLFFARFCDFRVFSVIFC